MSRKCGDSVQAAHAAIWFENVADGPQGAGHEKHNYNCPGRSGRALVGGIATAAFMKSGDKSPDSISATTPNGESRLVDGSATDDGARGDRLDPSAPRGLEYADVLKVDPITESRRPTPL